jgi:hypothetical protein
MGMRARVGRGRCGRHGGEGSSRLEARIVASRSRSRDRECGHCLRSRRPQDGLTSATECIVVVEAGNNMGVK